MYRPFRRKRRKKSSIALDSADDVFTMWMLADLVELVLSLADDS